MQKPTDIGGTVQTFHTKNAGILTGYLSPDFKLLRGKANKRKLMGTLMTKELTVYKCYVACCDLAGCFCAMTVKKLN